MQPIEYRGNIISGVAPGGPNYADGHRPQLLLARTSAPGYYQIAYGFYKPGVEILIFDWIKLSENAEKNVKIICLDENFNFIPSPPIQVISPVPWDTAQVIQSPSESPEGYQYQTSPAPAMLPPASVPMVSPQMVQPKSEYPDGYQYQSPPLATKLSPAPVMLPPKPVTIPTQPKVQKPSSKRVTAVPNPRKKTPSLKLDHLSPKERSILERLMPAEIPDDDVVDSKFLEERTVHHFVAKTEQLPKVEATDYLTSLADEEAIKKRRIAEIVEEIRDIERGCIWWREHLARQAQFEQAQVAQQGQYTELTQDVKPLVKPRPRANKPYQYRPKCNPNKANQKGQPSAKRQKIEPESEFSAQSIAPRNHG
uniref:Uncharacterized protein n=1 Tax=Panagrellus redivivus TaxID=6233 RepID=A0A7E4UVV1_PANRE